MTQSFDKNVLCLIFGIPGAGKGTVSSMLASRNKNIAHLAPGDLYRSHLNKNTEFGQTIKKYIDNGLLVPNDITNDMMLNQIDSLDGINLIILDGYPRTLVQMEMIDKTLADSNNKIKFVINIDLDKEVAIQRILDRRVCENCNKTFKLSDSKDIKVCPKCKEPLNLIKRKDDTRELYEKRYKWTMEQVQPVIDGYKRNLPSKDFYNVKTDDSTTMEETYQKVREIIKHYWDL